MLCDTHASHATHARCASSHTAHGALPNRCAGRVLHYRKTHLDRGGSDEGFAAGGADQLNGRGVVATLQV